MCAARGDRRVVERLVMRSTWIMALALMPISALFVTLGDYATVIILGEKWAISGEVVRFLALAEVTGLIGMSLGKGNSAIGRPARGLYITMSTLPIVVVGVFFIAKEGAVGVAIFLTCLRWLTAIPYIYLCLRGSGFRAKLYLRGIFRLLFIFGLLLCLGFIMRPWVPAGFLEQVILLSTFVAMGYIVFFFLFMLFEEGRDVLQWLDTNLLKRVERYIPKMAGLTPALLSGIRKRL
jgi:O-antigen/teichoic acid export membrane protein